MSRIVSALRKRPAVLAEPEGDAGGTHDMLENGNFLRLLANSEAVIGAYQVWANALEGGKLNGRQRQLIALAVAEMNRSKYCLSAQFARGRRVGLSDEEILMARRGRAADGHTHALL